MSNNIIKFPKDHGAAKTRTPQVDPYIAELLTLCEDLYREVKDLKRINKINRKSINLLIKVLVTDKALLDRLKPTDK